MLPRDRLLARLQSRVTLVGQDQQTGVLEFFDSFDRDLWFAERVLYRRKRELVLSTVHDLLLARPIATCSLDQEMPGFADQLPASAVQTEVGSLLKLRAILPMIRMGVASESFAVKNEDGKTVVRLGLESLSGLDATGGTTLQLCCLWPVRGYDRETDELVAYLHDLGLYSADSMAAARVLGELAAVPEEHPSKHVARGDQDRTSRRAICQLMRDLWATARSREEGIVADIDTEFLHEYRVALRRIRSLLSLTKRVFPEPLTQALKECFRGLASVTNRLRDLDVYLLSREPYQQLLPIDLRPGLDPMFADFASCREREQHAVRGWLTSAAYEASVSEAERLLEAFERSAARDVTDPLNHKWGAAIIGKRYKKIAGHAERIDNRTADATIHQLRVECKKLRYALEFFGSVFDENTLAAAIKRLKRLQDALGVFNDLSVQRAFLANYLEQNQDGFGTNTALAASIGGLVGALYQRQIDQRGQAMDQIESFCSVDMAATFSRMSRPARRAA